MYFKNEPTGFHLIMLLKRDVSCSSVHASDMTLSVTNSAFLGIGEPSSACPTASPAGVDAALEGWRTFFLGGMAENYVRMEKVSMYEPETSKTVIVPWKDHNGGVIVAIVLSISCFPQMDDCRW